MPGAAKEQIEKAKGGRLHARGRAVHIAEHQDSAPLRRRHGHCQRGGFLILCVQFPAPCEHVPFPKPYLVRIVVHFPADPAWREHPGTPAGPFRPLLCRLPGPGLDDGAMGPL